MEGQSAESFLHSELTDKIIAAFYKVYSKLGYGFLEKVYENAMAEEMKANGIAFKQQAPIKVHYGNAVVGEYFADFLVEERVIIELKCAESVAIEHEHQLINYVKATGLEVGLLLNFGAKPQIRRKIFTKNRK